MGKGDSNAVPFPTPPSPLRSAPIGKFSRTRLSQSAPGRSSAASDVGSERIFAASRSRRPFIMAHDVRRAARSDGGQASLVPRACEFRVFRWLHHKTLLFPPQADKKKTCVDKTSSSWQFSAT